MRTRTALCLIGAMSLQAAACVQASPPVPPPPADSDGRTTNAASTVNPSAELLTAVRADAARILGVAADRIELVASESVVWPDGGLGCARPGEIVTMALTPGFRLQLRAMGGERLLVYHTNQRLYFRLCPTAVLRPLPPPARPDR